MSIRRLFLQKQDTGGGDYPLANIISEWKFDNNTLDTVGTNDGTGTNITYASGLVDQAVVFNSSLRKVIIPNASDLTFTNGSNDLPFSITFAVNSNSVSNNPRFFDKCATTSQNTNREFRLRAFAGAMEFYLYDGSDVNMAAKATTLTVTNSVWQHWTVTYDGSGLNSGMSIYRNGVEDSVLVDSGYSGMANLGEPITIGKDAFTTTNSLDGKMDCVRFWDKELTATEVSTIATAELAGTDINP